MRCSTRQLAWLLPLFVLLAAGCQQAMRTPYADLAAGDYGRARIELREQLVDDRSDRQYLLDRMRLGVLTLADGYPESAQTVFEQVYDLLRTQGINEDRTVASVVFHEGVKIWKGEPFEQALALAYYGFVQAELGSWDNARAAADNALFYLRDFGTDDEGGELDTYEIARRSLLYERGIAEGLSEEEAMRRADYLDHGYAPRESNFTLGYLLHGIASQQLEREQEASDFYNRVVELDPDLEELVEAFRAGRYNTVLVVSWGLGPRKQAYGPDNALARFVPRTPSNGAALRVRVGEYPVRAYPVVHDVNVMARDHMWNNLEDIRIAKSRLGTGLLYGGAIAAAIGADVDEDAALYGGLGAAAAGLLLKAGAQADTRYADVFPQRFYVVPLSLPESPQPIMLQVEGEFGSRLVLAGLGAPRDGQAQLRYVRLLSQPRGDVPPPSWATSGEVLYGNPHTGALPGPTLPYIFGGDDVRPPTERALDDYQQAGYLRGQTASDLRQWYALEGIVWTLEDQGGYAGRHVLEGGDSLVAPRAGTTGFARLFGQLHPPYRPRSEQVAAIARALAFPPPPAPPPEAVISRNP